MHPTYEDPADVIMNFNKITRIWTWVGKQAEGSSGGIPVSVGKFCPDNKTRRGGTARIGNKRARPTLSR
jgi:hypothetical protein